MSLTPLLKAILISTIVALAMMSEAKALNFVALSKLPESALRSIRCLSGASSNGLADEGNL